MKYLYPKVNLFLLSLKNFQDEELSRSVISSINSCGNDFIPQKYDIYEPLKRKYSSENMNDVVSLWMNYEVNQRYKQNGEKIAAGQVVMQRKKKPELDYLINWKKSSETQFNIFTFSVEIDYLKEPGNYLKYMSICKQFIKIIEPVYGEITNCSFPNYSQPVDIQIRLPEPQWMLILGKPYFDMFGKEKLLNTPCYGIEVIEDRIVLLQIDNDLFSEVQQSQKDRVKYYLGESAFVWSGNKVLAYKNKENMTPKFDFSGVLFEEERIKENREDTELKNIINDWSSHVFGLAKLYNINLDYSEKSIEKVEELAEIIHGQVSTNPSVKEENIEKVSKMIGSYLGEIIVKYIGGEWTVTENKVIAIILNNNIICYPIGKVLKRVKSGEGDNICLYYKALKSGSLNI